MTNEIIERIADALDQISKEQQYQSAVLSTLLRILAVNSKNNEEKLASKRLLDELIKIKKSIYQS